jgi:hypothetical protein
MELYPPLPQYVFMAWCLVKPRDTKSWWENLKGRDHSEDIDIDGRVILQWISEK